MPKMRTHSGSKKRMKRTASGHIKVAHAHRGHLLTNKNKSARRAHRSSGLVHSSDLKRIKQQISNVK